MDWIKVEELLVGPIITLITMLIQSVTLVKLFRSDNNYK